MTVCKCILLQTKFNVKYDIHYISDFCNIQGILIKICKSIELPEGLKSIGEGAFVVCRSLKSIELPEGLESIGDGMFDSCDSLATIYVKSGSYAEKHFKYNRHVVVIK